MKKLTLAFGLLLTASAAAHAQVPNGSPGSDPLREAQRQPTDAARQGEALITASRMRNNTLESEADSVRNAMPKTFRAEVSVTNHAAQSIKSVAWTATLLDPETGAVIRTYDVTTDARIAPGSTKRLSKHLRTPRTNVVRVASRSPYRPTVADLKVKVKAVTYVDGSTSATP